MVQVNEDDETVNRVVEFFVDKTIFITGGTGFLGKVLIEKLLRCCPDVRKIYVLIRSKKGKTARERLEDLFDGPLFEIVKKQRGKMIFAKVEAVNGDIAADGLGLSVEDRRKLVEEVQFIYHSAASVRFDEPFKNAIAINVKGTKQMLQLAEECKNLLIFSHVSTAYCQENQEVLEEKTYDPPADPHKIIDMCEWMDEKTLDAVADKIRGFHANNYTFAKALGEGLVTAQMDKLPVIITRPSAVVPVIFDPIPGWFDNINGPMGLLIGAGKGVIRTMYGVADQFADYVPVDIVASALILCAFDYSTYKERRVYNITTSDEFKVTFQQLIDFGKVTMINTPFNWVLWYPNGSLKQSRFLHYLEFFLYQLIPAVFVDMLLLIFGFKPILLKIQKRIFKGYKIFEYYANRKWNFKKDNGNVVRGLLNAKEKAMFVVKVDNVDYYDYYSACALGARRYILKEKDEDIPTAITRMKMMWYLDRICKILFFTALIYYFFTKVFVRLFWSQ